MNLDERDKTKVGMICGMLIGAWVALMLVSVTDDARWLSITGVGLVLALGIAISHGKRED